MINSQEYIDSGVLELYVYGTLSEAESREVTRLIAEHPELLVEVERIEKGLQQLSNATAPYTPSDFKSIYHKIKTQNGENVIPLSRKRTPLTSYLGWAAALVLLAGLGYQFAQNKKLEDKITDIQREQVLQEGRTQMTQERLVQTETLLDALRNKDIITVPLKAQEIAPDAYAAVYWDKDASKTYVDVRGLPQPPKGKVYQLWSLTLDPLTPTNMGVLDQYDTRGTQLFEIDNPNTSQAFGITLEPKGGSDTPTLEELYVLGVVEP